MTLLVLILEVLALLSLLLGTFIIFRLTYSNSATHRRARMFLVVSICAIGLSAAINGANFFQRKTGINLHMPADLKTKATVWVREHEANPPDRNQTSRNIAILAEGLAFLREHRDELSQEVKTKVAEYSELPGKPDHLLSIGEEGRYYRAAQDVYDIIVGLGPKTKIIADPSGKQTR